MLIFSIPARAAPEWHMLGMPLRFPRVMFTMLPPLSRMYWSWAARHTWKVPVRLVWTTAWKPLEDSSSAEHTNCPPALFTRRWRAL